MTDLIKKYNIQAPRYTSYPTVPYWNITPNSEQWLETVKRSFNESNSKDGISLYVHLPYCESLCTYCGCNTRITVNHEVEKPYIHAVLNEWKMYLQSLPEKPIIRQLHLGGGTPTFFSPENLNYLITTILKNSLKHPSFEFSFEAHPANTTYEHLKTLFELGFKRLSLGIQDFDQKVQTAINRKQTIEQVKRVVDQARFVGYTSINFDLIYGLAFQTKESIVQTIQKSIDLKPDRIAFYSYAHIPWLKPGQRKFTETDLPADEVKRNLYEIGKNLFIKAGYIEIGMDHFALAGDTLTQAAENGTLHRNFMGYTELYTQLLIGLGVSSISDSLYAFVQNKKTVKEYMDTVNNDLLPIFNGHLLTEDDLILRKHILNMMCKMHTDWNHPEMRCGHLKMIHELLSEPLKDELAILHDQQLTITEKGKPFLRNICMAFDARLLQNKTTIPIFSKAI